MAIENHKQMLQMLKQGISIIQVNPQPKFIVKWLNHTTSQLRELYTLQSQADASTQLKRQCETLISELAGLKLKLQKLQKVGRGERRPRQQQLSERVDWKDLRSAFENRIRTGVIINLTHGDAPNFLTDAERVFVTTLKKTLRKEVSVKVNTVLAAEYSVLRDNEEVVETKFFNTANQPILRTTDLNEWFQMHVVSIILRDMEEFQERDSGWTLRSIINLHVNVNKYNPMRAGTYIDLPEQIKNKKACVNIQNEDNECFKWAILSALHPAQKHSYRVSKYTPYKDELKFEGIKFPVTVKDVPKFEHQNDISVNVYLLQKPKNIYVVAPVHVTALKKERHINLLLVCGGIEYDCEVADEGLEVPNYHYVWICNLSRLVSSQLSKCVVKKYICERCLHYFHVEEKLIAHERDCAQVNKCRVDLPKAPHDKVEFKNFMHKERVPFIIYADFECLLKTIDPPQGTRANTEPYHNHEAFSVGYFRQCSYDSNLSHYNSYRGQNPSEWFSDKLLELANKTDELYNEPKPMNALTDEEKKAFSRQAIYHICEKPLRLSEIRVRDHCHLTGCYRGAAHQACNINYKDSHVIPIVFHNFSGYDSHLIIKDIATRIEGHINVLPINSEKYISVTKHVEYTDVKFRFIDSFRFMASSLEKLASYLPELPIIRHQFQNLNDTHFKLLTRKGVFPYEYLNGWNRLDDTALPSKDSFRSSLNGGSDISAHDYDHAKQVWSVFNIGTLGEYSDLYLKTDVLLLADVFENFRNQCVKAYGLDPAHYYTAPGLTWDAMLKHTKVELELLTDIDMVLFIERGIRGGLSQCSNRYARANNKHIPDYDPEEPSNYLMYYDVCNLYGWAMMQHLPYGGFEWVEDVLNLEWDVADNSTTGYILEVDLEYPQSLHDLHKDLPLCPESGTPPGSKQKKLLTTLNSKTRYIIHYRNLRQALKHGLILKHIHRVLKFKQSDWLKTYIDLNSEKRRAAKNEFEKNLFKLMNNAVYGKTMENVRKRVDVKLVTKWGGRYGAEALISRPDFHSRNIFAENLVAVQLKRLNVLLNKPIYVGFCVLDLSKTVIYDFHLEYMTPQFEHLKLLYTDTDSLIYQVWCDDIYSVMKRDVDRFDTSDYPQPNRYDIPSKNKKVVGKMKDECNGRVMTEFVGLRAKMYSVRVEGEDAMKKAKGVTTGVVKKSITFDDYVECLQNNSVQTREQFIFRTRLHNVQTVRQVKLALSPFDDKRYRLADSTDTLPWGHYTIP